MLETRYLSFLVLTIVTSIAELISKISIELQVDADDIKSITYMIILYIVYKLYLLHHLGRLNVS